MDKQYYRLMIPRSSPSVPRFAAGSASNSGATFFSDGNTITVETTTSSVAGTLAVNKQEFVANSYNWYHYNGFETSDFAYLADDVIAVEIIVLTGVKFWSNIWISTATTATPKYNGGINVTLSLINGIATYTAPSNGFFLGVKFNRFLESKNCTMTYKVYKNGVQMV